MGFRDARAALIAALEAGTYGHEARDVQEEKNLLAIGDVSEDFVIALLRKARGSDYDVSPHHGDATVDVHVFRPLDAGVRWYVKAYFHPDAEAVFISVHRA